MASRGGGQPDAAAPAAVAAAAAASSDSRQLTVPAMAQGTQTVCVEYPGYVGDEQRVLETLSGLEGIAHQLQVRDGGCGRCERGSAAARCLLSSRCRARLCLAV